MPRKERNTIEVQSERAVLAAVRLPASRYDVADPFGELRALTEQAGATVVGELSQRLERPVAGTYMGSGKVEELKLLCDALNAGVVIFDHDLAPKQISNIEEVVGRKIIDRSELILDIFASRATTHEAKLQVELAQLEYTYPRLRAMWDHLERIVGGGGIAGIGTRGPGEQQLEIDRRLVQDKKVRLTRQLEEIQARKRREVRARRSDNFTVGIVGYTNAGKSTLFNRLTAGGAYADDRLFATLMTRTREWDVSDRTSASSPSGLTVLLSDTVGFVRDLPHNLIASFRATLEEATHADMLLIVLDVSDPAAELHWRTVNETLDELFESIEGSGFDEDRGASRPPRILLLNKIDRLKDNARVLEWKSRVPGAIALSALARTEDPRDEHDGIAALTSRVRAALEGETIQTRVRIRLSDPRTISILEAKSKVLEREYEAEHVTLSVRIGRRMLDQLRASGVRFEEMA